MGQWVYKFSKLNIYIIGEDKSNFNKVTVTFIRSEAKWSNQEQIEITIEIYNGGLNSYLLKKIGMTFG